MVKKIDASARLRLGKPLFMTEEQAREKLLSGAALASAQRLINAFFGNEGERPRASIPARPDYDDDLILIDVLRYAEEVVRKAVSAVPDDLAKLAEDLRLDEPRSLTKWRAADVLEAQGVGLARLRAHIAANCRICGGSGISSSAGSACTGKPPTVTTYPCHHGIGALINPDTKERT